MHEFLNVYEDNLQGLDLVETRGKDYTTYQLELSACHWWRYFMDSRPDGFSLELVLRDVLGGLYTLQP